MELDAAQMKRVLHAAVRRICPHWLADQHEDLVQAALLKVVRISQAEEKAPPTTSYLWKVAHSAVMDEIRRRRSRPEVSLEVNDAATGASQPSGQYLPGELRTVIADGMKTLTASRRKAILLYFHGFSLEDTARLLGWTSKRVDNERYRGLAELRRFLDKRGYRP